jgi:hypothetical protein
VDLINKEIEMFNKGYSEHVEKCSKEKGKIEAGYTTVDFKPQNKSLEPIEEDKSKKVEVGLKKSQKSNDFLNLKNKKSESKSNKSFKEYYRSSRDGTKGYFKSTTMSRYQSEQELFKEDFWKINNETNRAAAYCPGFEVYMNNLSYSSWKSEPLLLEQFRGIFF